VGRGETKKEQKTCVVASVGKEERLWEKWLRNGGFAEGKRVKWHFDGNHQSHKPLSDRHAQHG
ncbi:MAG: hypothetical protein ACK5UX_06825, partial [Burkholderiales bacterium]